MDNSSTTLVIVRSKGGQPSTHSQSSASTQTNKATKDEQKSSANRDITINLCQAASFLYWMALPIRVLLVRIVHVERGLVWNHTERKETRGNDRYFQSAI